MLADTVPYVGHTTEGRAVTVEVRGRAVVGVSASFGRYACATFGDIGPLRVHDAGRAPVAASGRFRFAAGPDAQRLTVTGTFRRGGTLSGHVQVRGTIATGQRCASLSLRFVAHR